MRKLPGRLILPAAGDVLLLFLCLGHLPNVADRPALPLCFYSHDGVLFVGKVTEPLSAPGIMEGDRVLSWNGALLPVPEAAAYLAEKSAVGASGTLRVERAGKEFPGCITFVSYYTSGLSIVVIFFVGILFMAGGFFVRFRRPEDRNALALHWLLVAMGVAIMADWGSIRSFPAAEYISRVLFFLSYGTVAAGFYLFTTGFPKPRPLIVPRRTLLVSGASGLVAVVMAIFHLRAVIGNSLRDYATFQIAFNLFHILLLASFAGGLIHLATSYRNAETSAERRQLLWVFSGLFAGTAPFLALVVLPQLANRPALIPEAYATVFFLAIPFSFGVAIIRHRLFDIEVLINRGTVYTVALALLLALYVGLVALAAAIAGAAVSRLPFVVSATVAVLIAILFEPVRGRVQRFVDRKFFRVRYNFRQVVGKFADEIRQAPVLERLAAQALERINEVIPVDRSAFAAFDHRGRLLILAHLPVQSEYPASLSPVLERLLRRTKQIEGIPKQLESHTAAQPGVESDLQKTGCVLFVPMASADGVPLGCILLGAKRSGRRFGPEDIDLLTAVAERSGGAVERIRLQQAVVMEQSETQRLQELNAMKTFFVSSVSHDLRTPLTSIRMFAELLRSRGEMPRRRSREYLRIIAGESERLTRLIDTVLDFSRLERGKKEYRFESLDLNTVAREAAKTMRYPSRMEGVKLRLKLRKRLPPIRADRDALTEAVLNLIANGMKYSGPKKHITISTLLMRHRVSIAVADEGIGIAADELPQIFTPYYRGGRAADRALGGAGLGLTVVKEIVEAHGGTVDVASSPGRGSTFTLHFPVGEYHEEDSHH